MLIIRVETVFLYWFNPCILRAKNNATFNEKIFYPFYFQKYIFIFASHLELFASQRTNYYPTRCPSTRLPQSTERQKSWGCCPSGQFIAHSKAATTFGRLFVRKQHCHTKCFCSRTRLQRNCRCRRKSSESNGSQNRAPHHISLWKKQKTYKRTTRRT